MMNRIYSEECSYSVKEERGQKSEEVDDEVYFLDIAEKEAEEVCVMELTDEEENETII